MRKRLKPIPGRLSPTDLAHIIHEVIDEPMDKHGEPRLGWQIVKTIFKAISNALREGDYVEVSGFGRFFLRTQKGVRKIPNMIVHSKTNQHKGHYENTYSPVMIEIKGRKKIVFQPSTHLMAMLNGGTNWREKHSMEIW